MATKRKVGKRSGKGRPSKKQSWEAKELGDIRKRWQPGWTSSEGKRRTVRKST